jgi:HSP20 family protein
MATLETTVPVRSSDAPFAWVRLRFPTPAGGGNYAERPGFDYRVVECRRSVWVRKTYRETIAGPRPQLTLRALRKGASRRGDPRLGTAWHRDKIGGVVMVDFKTLVPWRNKAETPVTRDDGLDPFAALRRDVDRTFDDFLNGASWRSPLRKWEGVSPLLDVDETEKEIIVSAELPGVEEKDIEVMIVGDVLTIKGEKKAEREDKNGDGYYAERRFGSFARSLRLPFEVKDEKVDAQFKKGVLIVRVPKPAELQEAVRRIDVKSA